jgi:hypothetical protein
MLNFKYLIVVVTFGGLMSCATTKVTERSIETSDSEVIEKTLVADVRVDLDKKITGEVIVHKSSEKQAKAMADWQALQSSDAHIVIDPVYKMKKTGRTISCTVTAYSGYYENVKVASEQDLLDNIQYQQLGEIGIAGVSFEEYKYYYNNLKQSEEGAGSMSEEELENYYYQKVKEEKKSSPTKKDKPQGSVGLLIFWIIVFYPVAIGLAFTRSYKKKK